MNFITNLKIGTRLGLGFGLMLLLLVVVAGLGLNRMATLNQAVEEITQVNNPETKLAVTMRMAVNQVSMGVRDMIILTDMAEMKKVEEHIKADRNAYNTAEEKLGKMFDTLAGTTAKEKELFAKVKEWRDKTRPLNNKVIELGLANKAEEATRIFTSEVLAAQNQWLAALAELADFEEKLNDEAGEAAAQVYKDARLMLIALGVTALVLGVLAAVLITRSITAPIN